MPCHPHFPLMEFWSLKPPRSRQEEKVFPLAPIFFIYLYTFSMFVECTDQPIRVAGRVFSSPSQISH